MFLDCGKKLEHPETHRGPSQPWSLNLLELSQQCLPLHGYCSKEELTFNRSASRGKILGAGSFLPGMGKRNSENRDYNTDKKTDYKK